MKLERAEKRKSAEGAESVAPGEPKVTRLSCGNASRHSPVTCFFCSDSSGDLHHVTTLRLDTRVRQCALELQDTVLLAKLSVGDLISQEAVYHSNCLNSLYYKARKSNRNDDDVNAKEKLFHGIALAELISYIEDTRAESRKFKLADLVRMYAGRLQQLGVEVTSRINSTRLKNRILANIPGMQAQASTSGNDIFLVFKEDLAFALENFLSLDYDNEAMVLAQAATIVRRDMKQSKYTFKGSLEESCQTNSVPTSLLSLTNMLLFGANIKVNSERNAQPQASLTVAQLIQFNCTFRRHGDYQEKSYHSCDREPPLPLYLGLMIHAKTRKRGIVDQLFELGMAISYDRVLEISTSMGNSVTDRFQKERVVCPTNMSNQLFTTAAVDNIDHNPSSTTAKGSFHGTGISLFQHCHGNLPGENRTVINISNDLPKRKLIPLPEDYCNVPPVQLPKKDLVIPAEQKEQLSSNCSLIPCALEQEEG